MWRWRWRWRHRRRQGRGTIRLEIPPYRRRRFVSLMVVGCFLIGLAMSLWLIDQRLRPSLRALAEAKAKVMATTAVTEAIAHGEARLINYEDLVSVRSTADGRPVMIQPNPGRLNRLAAQITMDVQRSLAGLERAEISLPIGQVLGTQVLGSWGPRIKVGLLPIGTVESRILDSFVAAGINQTRHRILVRVVAEVRVVVPLVTSIARVTTDVPLAEAVIMGEVPKVYVNGGGVLPSISAADAVK